MNFTKPFRQYFLEKCDEKWLLILQQHTITFYSNFFNPSIQATRIRSSEGNVCEKVFSINRAKNRSYKQNFRCSGTKTFMQVVHRRFITFLFFEINMSFNSFHLNMLPASRCSIREILRKKSQLPHGIKLLRMPRSLKRYLDLLQDWKVINWVNLWL